MNQVSFEYQIETIRPDHDEGLQRVITTVGAEFGAIGDGFGPSDEEVNHMSLNYGQKPDHIYYVLTVEGQVKGGGGIAPFDVANNTCELRKLFILPEARGFGFGNQITERCLTFARKAGFERCYLDTLASMVAAVKLYEKYEFKHLGHPYKGSIHSGCDVWMMLTL